MPRTCCATAPPAQRRHRARAVARAARARRCCCCPRGGAGSSTRRTTRHASRSAARSAGCLGRADAVIVHSDAARRRVEEQGAAPPQRVHLIPHGHSTTCWTPRRATAAAELAAVKTRRAALRPAAPVQGDRRCCSMPGGGSRAPSCGSSALRAWTSRRCAPPRHPGCGSWRASCPTRSCRRTSAGRRSSCFRTPAPTSPAPPSRRWPSASRSCSPTLAVSGSGRYGAARHAPLGDPLRCARAWRPAGRPGGAGDDGPGGGGSRRPVLLGRDRAADAAGLRGAASCSRARGTCPSLATSASGACAAVAGSSSGVHPLGGARGPSACPPAERRGSPWPGCRTRTRPRGALRRRGGGAPPRTPGGLACRHPDPAHGHDHRVEGVAQAQRVELAALHRRVPVDSRPIAQPRRAAVAATAKRRGTGRSRRVPAVRRHQIADSVLVAEPRAASQRSRVSPCTPARTARSAPPRPRPAGARACGTRARRRRESPSARTRPRGRGCRPGQGRRLARAARSSSRRNNDWS